VDASLRNLAASSPGTECKTYMDGATGKFNWEDNESEQSVSYIESLSDVVSFHLTYGHRT